MQNVFLGVVLTATSVSITVETLQELGKLSTKVGTAVLAASLIDDILGLIALTIVTSMSGADVNILLVLGKIILFFVLAISFGFVVYKAFTWYVNKVNNVDLRRFPIIAFVVCLILAYCAEEFFGIADIIGAFIAGLIVSNTSKAKYIASKFRPLSYLLLTPVFFASIGIKVEIPEMNAYIIFFTISLVLVSFLSKIIGCGLGAKLSGFKMHESVQIGIGMVSRGEVALIIANKGLALRLLNENFFGPIIIMVVFAAVLTPILLKLSFRTDGMIERPISDLVKSYEKVEKINYLEDKLLDEKTIIK
ncbi:MAG TPA: cation:proton antiporter [Haloplasmataceae bacterium]